MTTGNLFEALDNKGKESSIETFSDRFNPAYLDQLLIALDPENLIKGKHKENGDDKKLDCIEINFCGHAASTLFGSPYGRTAISEESKGKLKAIKDAFLHLFKPETLAYFDGERIYLRVRICFGYPYSDFPVCLMKAEDSENWEHITANAYDFHTNKRLKESELKDSEIFKSQVHALEQISTLIDDNPSLLERAPNKHSIQIRFSVIPSPLCLLIINQRAYCDSYLYAIITDTGSVKSPQEFSLRYPVSIIPKDSASEKQFWSVETHFKYLWKHDLTLFCEDATYFEKAKKNYKELMQIRTPCDVKWTDKENRIRQHYEKFRYRNHNWIFPESDFQEWIQNVQFKFKLTTSKVILNSPCEQDKWNKLVDENKNAISIIQRLNNEIVDKKVELELVKLKEIRYIVGIVAAIVSIVVLIYSYNYFKSTNESFADWFRDNELFKEATIKGFVELLFKLSGFLILPISLFITKYFSNKGLEQKREELKRKYDNESKVL